MMRHNDNHTPRSDDSRGSSLSAPKARDKRYSTDRASRPTRNTHNSSPRYFSERKDIDHWKGSYSSRSSNSRDNSPRDPNTRSKRKDDDGPSPPVSGSRRHSSHCSMSERKGFNERKRSKGRSISPEASQRDGKKPKKKRPTTPDFIKDLYGVIVFIRRGNSKREWTTEVDGTLTIRELKKKIARSQKVKIQDIEELIFNKTANPDDFATVKDYVKRGVEYQIADVRLHERVSGDRPKELRKTQKKPQSNSRDKQGLKNRDLEKDRPNDHRKWKRFSDEEKRDEYRSRSRCTSEEKLDAIRSKKAVQMKDTQNKPSPIKRYVAKDKNEEYSAKERYPNNYEHNVDRAEKMSNAKSYREKNRPKGKNSNSSLDTSSSDKGSSGGDSRIKPSFKKTPGGGALRRDQRFQNQKPDGRSTERLDPSKVRDFEKKTITPLTSSSSLEDDDTFSRASGKKRGPPTANSGGRKSRSARCSQRPLSQKDRGVSSKPSTREIEHKEKGPSWSNRRAKEEDERKYNKDMWPTKRPADSQRSSRDPYKRPSERNASRHLENSPRRGDSNSLRSRQEFAREREPERNNGIAKKLKSQRNRSWTPAEGEVIVENSNVRFPTLQEAIKFVFPLPGEKAPTERENYQHIDNNERERKDRREAENISNHYPNRNSSRGKSYQNNRTGRRGDEQKSQSWPNDNLSQRDKEEQLKVDTPLDLCDRNEPKGKKMLQTHNWGRRHLSRETQHYDAANTIQSYWRAYRAKLQFPKVGHVSEMKLLRTSIKRVFTDLGPSITEADLISNIARTRGLHIEFNRIRNLLREGLGDLLRIEKGQDGVTYFHIIENLPKMKRKAHSRSADNNRSAISFESVPPSNPNRLSKRRVVDCNRIARKEIPNVVVKKIKECINNFSTEVSPEALRENLRRLVCMCSNTNKPPRERLVNLKTLVPLLEYRFGEKLVEASGFLDPLESSSCLVIDKDLIRAGHYDAVARITQDFLDRVDIFSRDNPSVEHSHEKLRAKSSRSTSHDSKANESSCEVESVDEDDPSICIIS